ncbi:GGDEF domain-containing phosphodiesterase [Vibrio sp. SCSIO 43136]|uniref:putative bifunctional diguanylate cyclase/phosphodiesterase n=1 Tax=Vibrio sp. SCSIO 43136 TaxID=2819101 RepID=UPI002075FBB9|nr:GGDEF domain-containing phosphodiesterase [Vibrio sp. SCSIO 43136]USD66183.1 EAL domain-containing protein [Vibrio sp. SCSIO 43136]
MPGRPFVSIVSKVAKQVRAPILFLTLASVVLLSIGSYWLSVNELKDNATARIRSIELSTASAIYNFDFEQIEAITSTFDGDSLFSHFAIWSEGEMLAQTHILNQPKKQLIWSNWEHEYPLYYNTAEGERLHVGTIEAYVDPTYLYRFFLLYISAFSIAIFAVTVTLLFIVRRAFHNTIAHRLRNLSGQFAFVRDDDDHLPQVVDEQVKERDEISELVDVYNLSSNRASKYIEAINQNNELLGTLAQKDPLTGNLNRQAFIETMESVLTQQGTHGTVIRVNVQNFSSINLKFGQTHGDNILKKLSQKLIDNHPKEAVVCRLGGDEFFVFLPSSAPLQGKDLFENIRLAVSDLGLDVNIGVARHPLDASEPELLIHCAEIALLEAKEKKLDYSHYHLNFEEHLKHKIYLDSVIDELLVSRNFHIYYQPQIMLDSGKYFGVESLFRMKDGDQSSPWEVITRAEETGSIQPLTYAIIEKIFQQWQPHGDKLEQDFTIAVNISPQSLASPDFVSRIRHLANLYHFPLNRLVLELTEITKVNQGEQVTATLDELRALDIRLSLDDFGTGFSSLEYLLSYGFDELKIDRKFVMNIDSRDQSVQIIKVIKFLCNTIGMQAIAEGIETEQEEQTLKSLGIQIGQGFRYSHAIPLERLFELMEKSQTQSQSSRAE